MSVEHLDPGWIASRRWFRAKQRPVAWIDEADRASVADGIVLHVLEVHYADGGEPDRYLAITARDREPSDGDGAWAALLRSMALGLELHGEAGSFRCTHTPALAELLPSAPEAALAIGERRLTVEQSNTSVLLGDRLILKLYRLLEAGENPDLEISAFLTRAGFAETPAVAGSMTYHSGGQTSAAAMLQAFVPSRGDAWAAMLDALATDPAEALALASAVGALTARMHAALASHPEDPAFPARAATVAEAAAWRTSAERQLALAVASVDGERHARLVELAPRISARFADTFGSASGDAMVSRIHGDYHLGQLLARTDGGLSVIDFEGEPARPLAERRLPSSPLRDVAGMLRSLDYAARTAESGGSATGFDADRWLADAREALIVAYGGIDTGDQGLLDAFELEKACYEVRYEANNRPDWAWLPLAAVERLVA